MTGHRAVWVRLAALFVLALAVGLAARPSATGATAEAPAAEASDAPRVGGGGLGAPQAVVLGVVEGVTEFLPISSTGHLLVAERLMNIGSSPDGKAAADTYAIAIQAGAILAVLVLYRRRLVGMAHGAIGRNPEGRHLLAAVLVAFLPAATAGVIFEGAIRRYLLEPIPVIAAWAAGGIALVLLGHRIGRGRVGVPIGAVTLRQAVVIGAAQCISLWPGTSRSLVTLVAAVAVGLSLGAAVEFSFLLGFVTLGAATAFELVKNGSGLISAFGVVTPLIGFLAAFISAVVAVRWLVSYVQDHDLAPFGWYRLGVATLASVLLIAGWL